MKIRIQFVSIIATLLLAALASFSCCKDKAVVTSCKMQTLEEKIQKAIVQIDATETSLRSLIENDQANLKNVFDEYAANVTKMDNIAAPLDEHINQINMLGKDYFTEWEKQGDKYTNPQIAGLNEQRRADLSALYDRIPQANVGVMSSLHAFMSYIIETRTYLKREITPMRIEAITPVVQKAIKEGGDFKDGLKRVLTAMEQTKTV